MEKVQQKKVQLITYPDSMGENLHDLDYVLNKHLSDVVGSVHILPFYPSSADRGFSPITQSMVDERFGQNEDITAIAKHHDVMADLVVNHVSKKSKYFQDYINYGSRSRYHNFFIKARDFSRRFYLRPKTKILRYLWYAAGQSATFLRNIDFIFHKHGVNRLILKKIYRPRPGSPFVKFDFKNGESRFIWCTFSADQIDLNIKSRGVKRKLARDIKFLADLGVKYIRLDAVGYVCKRRGTNNFLLPETIKFIKRLASIANKRGMLVIPEIHFDYKTQISLAKLKGVDYVYDFALPFLGLNAFYFGNGDALKAWIRKRPENSITTLDTHDGIGVVDVKGLLSEREIEKTAKQLYLYGGNTTKRASGNGSNNVDVYQINCTYFSALGNNDAAYIAVRAIQIFLPGIPQIYYVGLLAGENDERLLDRTKNGRDINRHFYSLAEIKKEIEKPVVKSLFKLCRIRNNHIALRGKFSLLNTEKHIINFLWQSEENKLFVEVNLKNAKVKIIENEKKVLFEYS